MNRGDFRHYIEIWEETETNQTDELGETVLEYQKKIELFANVETRVGGLLSGRPADTVMTTVTHKITYPYNNFPNIRPEKHIIKYRGATFDVNYTLNEGFKDEVLQVFVTEKNVR